MATATTSTAVTTNTVGGSTDDGQHDLDEIIDDGEGSGSAMPRHHGEGAAMTASTDGKQHSASQHSVHSASHPHSSSHSTLTYNPLLPLSSHYALLNTTLLPSFRTAYAHHALSIAYAVGVKCVEMALVQLPQHGYFGSDKRGAGPGGECEMERRQSVRDAFVVTEMLDDMVRSEHEHEGVAKDDTIEDNGFAETSETKERDERGISKSASWRAMEHTIHELKALAEESAREVMRAEKAEKKNRAKQRARANRRDKGHNRSASSRSMGSQQSQTSTESKSSQGSLWDWVHGQTVDGVCSKLVDDLTVGVCGRDTTTIVAATDAAADGPTTRPASRPESGRAASLHSEERQKQRASKQKQRRERRESKETKEKDGDEDEHDNRGGRTAMSREAETMVEMARAEREYNAMRKEEEGGGKEERLSLHQQQQQDYQRHQQEPIIIDNDVSAGVPIGEAQRRSASDAGRRHDHGRYGDDEDGRAGSDSVDESCVRENDSVRERPPEPLESYNHEEAGNKAGREDSDVAAYNDLAIARALASSEREVQQQQQTTRLAAANEDDDDPEVTAAMMAEWDRIVQSQYEADLERALYLSGLDVKKQKKTGRKHPSSRDSGDAQERRRHYGHRREGESDSERKRSKKEKVKSKKNRSNAAKLSVAKGLRRTLSKGSRTGSSSAPGPNREEAKAAAEEAVSALLSNGVSSPTDADAEQRQHCAVLADRHSSCSDSDLGSDADLEQDEEEHSNNLESLSRTCRTQFDSLLKSGQVRAYPLSTVQGRTPGSINGCTVIAPLAVVRHLRGAGDDLELRGEDVEFMDWTEHQYDGDEGDDDGINDSRRSMNSAVRESYAMSSVNDDDVGVPDLDIEDIIDEEAPALLPVVRGKLSLSRDALIIPSDVHDHLLEVGMLRQDQFVAVCGGNILDEEHLSTFVRTLSGQEDGGQSASALSSLSAGKTKRRIAATLFFHEHVVCLHRLVVKRRKKIRSRIDTAPPRRNKRDHLFRRKKDASAPVFEETIEERDEIWFDLIDSLPAERMMRQLRPSFSRGTNSAANSSSFRSSNGDFAMDDKGDWPLDEADVPAPPPPSRKLRREGSGSSPSCRAAAAGGPDSRHGSSRLSSMSTAESSLVEATRGSINNSANDDEGRGGDAWANRAVRIRCGDVESLRSVLRWYACTKFTEEDRRFIDKYGWQDKNSDFDPRVFQAFVWAEEINDSGDFNLPVTRRGI